MENLLSLNVRCICKEQNIQLKELAERMDIAPAVQTRVLSSNTRLDTMQKMANALGALKRIFEPQDDVEGLSVLENKFICLIIEDN